MPKSREERTAILVEASKPYRWQKGVQPPGAGKQKGSRHLSSIIRKIMEDDDYELKLKNGKILKGQPTANIVKVMYGLALSGDVRAAEWLAKHGYGVKNYHEVQHDPIEVILNQYGLNEGGPNPDVQEGEIVEPTPIEEQSQRGGEEQ